MGSSPSAKPPKLVPPERLEILVRIHCECRRLTALEAAVVLRLGLILAALARPGIDGSPLYFEAGYRTMQAFCKARLGVSYRTGLRWRQLADVEKYPFVWEAFQAGRIHQSKVLQLMERLKKHPEEEEVLAEHAERLTVAQLTSVLREEPTEENLRKIVRFIFRLAPDELRDFREAVEVVRRMVARDVSKSEAWELILADLKSRLDIPHIEVDPEALPTIVLGRTREVDTELDAVYRGWDFLGARLHPIELIQRPLPVRAEDLVHEAMDMMLTVQRVELAIGDLLWLLDRYDTPCFRNIGHFASECMGYSDSKARNLVRRAKCLDEHPQIKRRLAEARTGFTRFDLVMPLIERGCDAEVYVEFAEQSELRRLETKVRKLRELSDPRLECWYKRVPTDLEIELSCPDWLRDAHFNGVEAMGATWTQLVISRLAGLAPVTALAGLGILDELIACQTLAPGTGPRRKEVVELPLESAVLHLQLKEAFGWAMGEDLTTFRFVQLASRMFLRHNGKDGFTGMRKLLERLADYRCEAPDCGSRNHRHKHHLMFVAQLGPDAPWNLIIVCMCCHLRLIHANKLKVSGHAPDALVWRRLDEVYEGSSDRSWTVARRYTGPQPRSDIRVEIEDPLLLEELAS